MRTIKRDIVGAFIFSADNRLLMGKAGVYKDQWAIPGGGIEEGETKLEALRREILEEVGIDINKGKIEEIEGALTGQSEKNLRDTGERVLVDMTFYNYRITLPQPAEKIKIKAEDDFKEARWFSIKELSDIPLTPPSVTTLQKLGYLK
jgi:8-oxo-dGTP diphosphatase